MRPVVWQRWQSWQNGRHGPPGYAPAPFGHPAMWIVGGVMILTFGSVIFSVILALFALMIGGALATGMLALLGVGAWQLARLTFASSGRRSRSMSGAAQRRMPSRSARALAPSPVEHLRRQYAAGEIGQTQFKRQLVELLKERYVRGDLTLAEYETRVHHVLNDPALRSPADRPDHA